MRVSDVEILSKQQLIDLLLKKRKNKFQNCMVKEYETDVIIQPRTIKPPFPATRTKKSITIENKIYSPYL